jgi:hypothetical protein
MYGKAAAKYPLLVLAASTLLFSGCRRFQTLELPERPAHTQASRQEKEGLTVAAEVFADPLSVRHYFGPELWGARIFPVIISLENRGENTFEIQRQSFTIWIEGSAAARASTSAEESGLFTPLSPQDVIAQCSRSSLPAYLLAPFLVFPAFLAHNDIDSYNLELAADLRRKALPAYYRLEEGDGLLQGALFFRRPKGVASLADLLKTAELRLRVVIEGSRVEKDTAPDEASGAEERRKRVGEVVTFVLSLSSGEER